MWEPTKKLRTNSHPHRDDLEEFIHADDLFKELFADRPVWSVHLSGLRHRENLTQAGLGKLVGLHQSMISEMENGRRPIGKKTAKKLADFFDTDYRMFL